VGKDISKIKSINYKNYFQYAYQKENYPKYDRSKCTLRKKLKNLTIISNRINTRYS